MNKLFMPSMMVLSGGGGRHTAGGGVSGGSQSTPGASHPDMLSPDGHTYVWFDADEIDEGYAAGYYASCDDEDHPEVGDWHYYASAQSGWTPA